MGKRKRRREREHALENQIGGKSSVIDSQSATIEALQLRLGRGAWRAVPAVVVAFTVGLLIGWQLF